MCPCRHPGEGRDRSTASTMAGGTRPRIKSGTTRGLNHSTQTRPFGHRVTLTAAPALPRRLRHPGHDPGSFASRRANRKGLTHVSKTRRTNRQCSALLFEKRESHGARPAFGWRAFSGEVAGGQGLARLSSCANALATMLWKPDSH